MTIIGPIRLFCAIPKYFDFSWKGIEEDLQFKQRGIGLNATLKIKNIKNILKYSKSLIYVVCKYHLSDNKANCWCY